MEDLVAPKDLKPEDPISLEDLSVLDDVVRTANRNLKAYRHHANNDNVKTLSKRTRSLITKKIPREAIKEFATKSLDLSLRRHKYETKNEGELSDLIIEHMRLHDALVGHIKQIPLNTVKLIYPVEKLSDKHADILKRLGLKNLELFIRKSLGIAMPVPNKPDPRDAAKEHPGEVPFPS